MGYRYVPTGKQKGVYMENTGATTGDKAEFSKPAQTDGVVSIPERKTEFGKVLAQQGYITAVQLHEVRNIQRGKRGGERMPIGELCVELGYLSRNALKVVLERYQKRILLGDLFLNMGIISIDQLHEALTEQKITRKKLGQVLIDKGFIDRVHLNEALSTQLGIPMITPDQNLVNSALFYGKNPSFFYNARSVPISLDNKTNIVTVAMEDPLDTGLISDLEKAFGATIQPAVLESGDIDSLLNRVFNGWDRGWGNDGRNRAPALIPFSALNLDPFICPRPQVASVGEFSATKVVSITPEPQTLILTDDGETINPWSSDFEQTIVETQAVPRNEVHRIAGFKTTDRSVDRTGLGTDEERRILEMLDLSAIDDQIELSPAAKDMVIEAESSGVVARGNTVGILDFVILSAVKEGASDIHIEPLENKIRVRYRVDGVLRHKTDLPKSTFASLSTRIKVLCGADIAERRKHQDGRIEARVGKKDIDLRVSTYAALFGENIVIRVLSRSSTLVDINKIGMTPLALSRYQRLLNYPAGIMLVTGPTGSGKTTTLYASLVQLNTVGTKIITVEDPVEYTIEGVIQARMDPKLNMGYGDFLKSMMRQDPDIIMIGEIRDEEAAAGAIQAALTGHKVFSTFHTDDTTSGLLRLMNMGIETFLISSTMVGIVAQRLVRVLCPNCKERATPSAAILKSFTSIDMGEGLAPYDFYAAKGCSKCGGTGYKKRVGVHEILEINEPIREAILEKKTSSQIRGIARETARLISMAEDGFYKAAMGITTLEEVLRVVFVNNCDAAVPYGAGQIIELCGGREKGDGQEDGLFLKPTG
jgi:type II secretory ATPase GspE/PulE/Tfp pilus assembly ATPase PilB-like protein